MMQQIARALADARDIMYEAILAAQQGDILAAAEALERVEKRLRDALALAQERQAA